MSPVLYSTQPWFALHVGKSYRRDRHYVWCSEYFSSKSSAALSYGSAIGPTSDPINIYEQLYKAVQDEDVHDPKIIAYKKKFKLLAREWLSSGAIDQQQCEEIVGHCKRNGFRIWRPVLFVIPRPDESRIEKVVPKHRAGAGPELRIVDLHTQEFSAIELPALERRF